MESILICSRALGVAFGRKSELEPRPVPWGPRREPEHADAWFACSRCPKPLPELSPSPASRTCLVLGGPEAFQAELQGLLGEGCEVQPPEGEAMEAALKRQPWQLVVFAASLAAVAEEDAAAQGPTMAALLRVAQVVADMGPIRFVVLTAGAQEAAATGAMARGLMGSAAWGFMRSMPFEAPRLRTQLIDLPGPQSPL